MKLVFACGATIEVADATQATKIGERLVVYTSPHQGHQRPIPGPEYMGFMKFDKPANEYRMQCFLMCPVGKRRSGIKIGRGWFGEKNPVRGTLVECKVVEHQP